MAIFAVFGDQEIAALQLEHVLWIACEMELKAMITRVCFDPLIRFSVLHLGQATNKPVPTRKSILCMAVQLKYGMRYQKPQFTVVMAIGNARKQAECKDISLFGGRQIFHVF